MNLSFSKSYAIQPLIMGAPTTFKKHLKQYVKNTHIQQILKLLHKSAVDWDKG
jgi:hypothetical protein